MGRKKQETAGADYDEELPWEDDTQAATVSVSEMKEIQNARKRRKGLSADKLASRCEIRAEMEALQSERRAKEQAERELQAKAIETGTTGPALQLGLNTYKKSLEKDG